MFLLIGPFAPAAGAAPGGQATACAGLLAYLRRAGTATAIVDTSVADIDARGMRQRFAAAWSRLRQTRRVLAGGGIEAAVIFSPGGLGVIERALQARLCRRAGVPSLLFIRSGHFLDQVRRSRPFRWLARRLLRQPDLLGAQGSEWRRRLHALGVAEARIVEIPNWLPEGLVPVADAKPAPEPTRPLRFVFVGSLVEAKGLNELLAAVRSSTLLPACELRIVGGGDLADSLSRAIAADPALAQVRLAGRLPAADVYAELRAADVFVLPSHTEGFPNAMLEAMAFALPCIVSDVGAVADSLADGRNGFLVPARDVDALREAMERYVRTPALVAEHSAAALAVVAERHLRDVNCALLVDRLAAARRR